MQHENINFASYNELGFSFPFQPYCLPIMPVGDHADLKSISHETMSKLLRGDYDHVVEKYVIVDSRYPYEYVGGHITGTAHFKIHFESNVCNNSVFFTN